MLNVPGYAGMAKKLRGVRGEDFNVTTNYFHPPYYRHERWNGMGDECEKFLKNLAELLAKEDGEDYSDVMMSLRTMLSFQVLRAAVLCVRGSRRPWAQNASKLSSDFGLTLFEAGLKGYLASGTFVFHFL